MRTAIGYLRSDVSGIHQSWDETRTRSTARARGYDLAKTVVFTCRVQDPIRRLIEVVHRVGAASVVIPNLAHLDGALPRELLRVADVITVDPHRIYTIRSTPHPVPGPRAHLEGALRRCRNIFSPTLIRFRRPATGADPHPPRSR